MSIESSPATKDPLIYEVRDPDADQPKICLLSQVVDRLGLIFTNEPMQVEVKPDRLTEPEMFMGKLCVFYEISCARCGLKNVIQVDEMGAIYDIQTRHREDASFGACTEPIEGTSILETT